jgi:L-proline amide hydrolase
LVVAWNVSQQAGGIRVPTLALRGDFDEAQERVVKPWLENIPDVKEVVIRGGSHIAHLEYPFAYVKAIQTFFGRR